MVFADDIRRAILEIANDCGSGKLFYPSEVAKLIDLENWPELIDRVQLVAKSLIDEGKILLTTSGEGEEVAYRKNG